MFCLYTCRASYVIMNALLDAEWSGFTGCLSYRCLPSACILFWFVFISLMTCNYCCVTIFINFNDAIDAVKSKLAINSIKGKVKDF